MLALLQRCAERPLSVFAHHGGRCCETARLWVAATDAALRADAPPASGPRWMRMRWRWGPSRWPLYWCEAVAHKTLDCGALAWMSIEAFRARGVSALPAQVIQQYDERAVAHWGHAWAQAGASPHWLGEDGLVYHELCAVPGAAGALRLWDPSAGWWLESRAGGGYGGVAALKVLRHPTDGLQASKTLTWAGQKVVLNSWTVLSGDDSSGYLEDVP